MLIALLRRQLAPYRHWLLGVLVLQFCSVLAMLALPSLNAAIIDDGVVQGDIAEIMRLGAIMLVISLVQVACSVGATWFAAHTAQAFGRDTRRDLFQRVGTFSQREVQEFGAPSLITRTTNDVQQVSMVVLMGCTMMVSAPIMMIGGIFMAMREDFGLSWLLAVVVPVLFLAVGTIVSQMIPAFRLMQERLDEVNRVLREQIMGIRVIRAFVRERRETDRFAGANDNLTAVAIRTGRWQATMFPVAMLIINASTVAVIWFGGHRVDSGQMEVGALTAFIAYLMQILMSVMMATFMFMMLPRAAVSGDRIMGVLTTDSSVVSSADPVTELAGDGRLELTHVTFTYPGADEPVLSDISFTAVPGQTIAIIGSTGAGKSTLINLIPRLFDASAGEVRVDGINVRDIEPEVLYSHLGLVPQQAFLFTGSIAQNLRHGKPDATDDELWSALEITQARDFVAALPDGLDTAVSQGGTNFSGGQRQRLAMARAVCRRPQIYLFDDSFSALDLATDARVRARLGPVTQESTVIIVAQRVSTIRNADLILVLEDGDVVGRGTHADLLETSETYREIVASQLAAEDAA